MSWGFYLFFLPIILAKFEYIDFIAPDVLAVWYHLNNPETLKTCITGCEKINKLDDTNFEATVVAKVGPVRAKFNGKVNLSDIVPLESYRINGQGKGGVAGMAKGGALVTLSDVDNADDPTKPAVKLSYEVSAQVGGKLAQIGSRLIDATAKKFADDFFSKFSKVVAADKTTRKITIAANANVATSKVANAKVVNANINTPKVANANIANANINTPKVANANIANAKVANANTVNPVNTSSPDNIKSDKSTITAQTADDKTAKTSGAIKSMYSNFASIIGKKKR